jgi:hypothetical protein
MVYARIREDKSIIIIKIISKWDSQVKIIIKIIKINVNLRYNGIFINKLVIKNIKGYYQSLKN